jgi:hypothetical protein
MNAKNVWLSSKERPSASLLREEGLGGRNAAARIKRPVLGER